MIITTELTISSVEEIVRKTNLRHIAIIMDGNRRWAKKHKLPSMAGHSAGVKSLKNAVIFCNKTGIKYLTVYAFSTENWGRKKEEVDFLMSLMAETFKRETIELHKNNVKITAIGNIDTLNSNLRKTLLESMKTTEENTGVNLQVAINYGSRDEITNAVKNIAKDVQAGNLTVDQINSDLISNYLYTSQIPDPDLLIRTGSEYRLSNYLLWQSAYTEIYVSDLFWPEFNDHEFEKAIYEFAKRGRRFGKD